MTTMVMDTIVDNGSSGEQRAGPGGASCSPGSAVAPRISSTTHIAIRVTPGRLIRHEWEEPKMPVPTVAPMQKAEAGAA